MYEMIECVNEILPENKPRYLMGVGTPANILNAIERGVDMFDCVMPTRNGRNAMLFTAHGVMNMRNAKWADDFHLLMLTFIALWMSNIQRHICIIYIRPRNYWLCKLVVFIIWPFICG